MASPFPGMDPYIEASGLWLDFHNHFVERVFDQLADMAPERYLVRTGERSYLVLVESEGKEKHQFLPDVSVAVPRNPESTPKKKIRREANTRLVEGQPITLRAFVSEDHRESFVEIYETDPEQRLVTCIEVLSPSNKRAKSTGRDEYLRKRQSLLLGGVNLVEIDLLRGGERMPMLDSWPDSPYTLMVARANRAYACKVWEGHFRTKLPSIPVPLVKPEPDLALDLQPIVDGIYRKARYARSIDYSQPLNPPLTEEEAAWLGRQVRSRKPKA